MGNEDNECKAAVYHAWKSENCQQDYTTQGIIACYYALTTLSTVGYGDYYPISIREMLVGIVFILFGIVFFS